MNCWMLWEGSGEAGEQGNKRGNVVGARVGVQGAGKSGDGTGRRTLEEKGRGRGREQNVRQE